MMVVFFQAARLAMVTFDPFLSSRPLARAILEGPPGTVIIDSQYWIYSSIPFYTGRNELLLNGRWNNLEYGSYAPGAPDVFINDAKFQELWVTPTRYYLVTKSVNTPRLNKLVGADKLHVVASGGGKLVYTNYPLTASVALLDLLDSQGRAEEPVHIPALRRNYENCRTWRRWLLWLGYRSPPFQSRAFGRDHRQLCASSLGS